MQKTSPVTPLLSSSRYELLVRIASGGMATVYVGRKSGAVGFWRLVAIKRAHPHLLEEPGFAKMIVAEARLASKLHHPNIVAVQDVEELDGELLLVMDYVEGASLSALITQTEEVGRPIPLRVALRIVLDAAAGLHAAHELTDDDGNHLGVVHRDVSPHNILCGIDGVARLADFGIAKVSSGSGAGTNSGALKGKVAYMAPEYVETSQADSRSDVFSLGIVAWEVITRRRLYRGANEVETLRMVLSTSAPAPSSVAPWVKKGVDDVVLKALDRDPNKRFQSAAAFAEALEAAARGDSLLGAPNDVAAFVRALAGPALSARRALVRRKLPPEEAANVAPDGEPGDTDTLPHDGPILESSDLRTATLPGVDELPPADPPIAAELSTLGTGASASSVDAARAERARMDSRWWFAGIASVFAVGAVFAAATLGLLASRARGTETGAAPTAASTVGTSSSISALAQTSTSTSTSSMTPASATPAAVNPTSTQSSTRTFPSPSPSGSAKPRVKPLTQDKAPPNPYAK